MSSRWPGRFPAEPAQRAIRGFGRAQALSLAEIAEVLAVDQRLLKSVMSRRWLPWDTADKIAIALRQHPLDLWPDWLGARRRHSQPVATHTPAGNDATPAGSAASLPKTGASR